MSQFPEFCETFILNEVIELGKRDVPFEIFSLKKCRDPRFQPGARKLMEQATHYPPPIWSPRIWGAHAACLAGRPRAYLSTLFLALSCIRGPVPVFLKNLFVFLLAPWFARRLRERGLRHVHAHWASIPASAGLFISRLAGVPYSLTAHAYDIFIDQTLLREKIREARYVVTCTNYNRRFLEITFPEETQGKVHTVYHGVDLDLFNLPHDSAAEEPVILSIGRLCDTKGFPDLIDACRILRDQGLDFTCRIVGDGYMREELEKRVRDSGLEDRVLILGLQPRDRVLEEYRRARLFVLPCVVTERGDRDGLPNVVVEAMAMGLPVVATDISALGEGVEDGRTGRLVPSRDPVSMARAIAGLWEAGDTRREMGDAARGKAHERFGLSMNMEKLAELIRRQECSGL
ncbi:glycosyltransferase family 4 protein [bacterium]|nr:glycosyltransferase family 4 protein [bacterium]